MTTPPQLLDARKANDSNPIPRKAHILDDASKSNVRKAHVILIESDSDASDSEILDDELGPEPIVVVTDTPGKAPVVSVQQVVGGAEEPEETPEEKHDKMNQSIQQIVAQIELDLTRVINGKPMPTFPCHPQNRNSPMTPHDMAKVLVQMNNHEISSPMMLTVLVSKYNKFCELYIKCTQGNSLKCSVALIKYFTDSGMKFERKKWVHILLPPLTLEHITAFREAAKTFPSTIVLPLPLDCTVAKCALDGIPSSPRLIAALKINPHILRDATSSVLSMFFPLGTHMELRRIAGIESRKSRTKALDRFIRIFKERQTTRAVENQLVITGGDSAPMDIVPQIEAPPIIIAPPKPKTARWVGLL